MILPRCRAIARLSSSRDPHQTIDVLGKERERNRDSVSNESRIVYQDRLSGASLFILPFTRANKNDSVNFLFTGTVSFRIP